MTPTNSACVKATIEKLRLLIRDGDPTDLEVAAYGCLCISIQAIEELQTRAVAAEDAIVAMGEIAEDWSNQYP